MYSIGIIGMDCRFPEANSTHEYWNNLLAGSESIRSGDGGPGARKIHRHAVPDGLKHFDAAFFGLTEREVTFMDPQHRMALECTYNALDDAGHTADCSTLRTGVFVGTTLSFYLFENLLADPQVREEVSTYDLILGNDKSFAATRISYLLNLSGPSLCVDTACSTSLTAVHLACRSLLMHECDLAVVATAALRDYEARGYDPGPKLAADGCCRPYDQNATGMVPGNGAGAVVLRRLPDAEADRDQVYAVIKSSAINNDGYKETGYTTPGVKGQHESMAMARELAGLSPRDIRILEGHGTGAPVSDAIELTALAKTDTNAGSDRPTYLGSAKSNIGHLDVASGMAGLIKACLVLRHEVLPPTLHFTRLAEPSIDAKSIRVNVKPINLQDESPLILGVSSFGTGGSNAHVILEQPKPTRKTEDADQFGSDVLSSDAALPPDIVLLSAKSPEALNQVKARLLAHLRANPEEKLADLAFTTQLGRVAHPFRLAVACESTAQLAEWLSANYQSDNHQISDCWDRVRSDLNLKKLGVPLGDTDGFYGQICSGTELRRTLREVFSSFAAAEDVGPMLLLQGYQDTGDSESGTQHEGAPPARSSAGCPTGQVSDAGLLSIFHAADTHFSDSGFGGAKPGNPVDRLIAAYWMAGGQVDWKRYRESRPGRRISLPLYPFDRKKLWISGPERTEVA